MISLWKGSPVSKGTFAPPLSAESTRLSCFRSDDPVPLAQVDVTSPVKQVLLTCHALANLDGEIIGDPLEKATLNALDWTVSRNDTVTPNKGRAGRWQIHHRYHFLSALKRMSVIAGQSPSAASNDMAYIVAVKGAPETLKPMVSRVSTRCSNEIRRMTFSWNDGQNDSSVSNNSNTELTYFIQKKAKDVFVSRV